jgi:MGT family glycosyltransferase
MRSLLRLSPQLTRDWLRLLRFGPRIMPRRLPLLPRPGTLTILLASRELHPRVPQLDDPHFAFVGPSLDPVSRWAPFDFSRLDGRPLILVSLGSVFATNLAFFKDAMAALASLHAQVVLVAGAEGVKRLRAEAPENCIVVDAIPQLEVLPRTSVFLMHGGVGSMHESLWHGVPLVAVPQQLEQLVTAMTAQDAGAAIVIEDECFGRRVTAAQLRNAVERVLADERYRQRARALGDALQETGGWKEAADRIEGVLLRGVPR